MDVYDITVEEIDSPLQLERQNMVLYFRSNNDDKFIDYEYVQ